MRATIGVRRRLGSAAVVLPLVVFLAPLTAHGEAATTPPPATSVGSQAATPPATPPPTAAPPTAAPPPPVEAPALPRAERPGPIPTGDEAPAATDHDAVVGRIGIEARRMDVGPLPLTLGANGCPAATTAAGQDCTVMMGVLGVRYWSTRNLAWNVGLAFAAGGGRDGTQALDSYVGLGPVLGLSVLVGNWRHLSVAASPELAFVWFRPGGDNPNTKLVQMRAALEGELHFGFVHVPALSVGIVAGLGFQYESVPEARIWSVGVLGGESVWGTLTNLFVRYYL